MKNNTVYNVESIFEGAWAISERQVRCFLITGSERALLIDTGYGGGDLKSLVRELTSLPVVLAITHSDGDHICGMSGFDAACMHPAEFGYFARNAEELTEIKLTSLMPLWEGDLIDLGGYKFEAVLIPGHTPGSIALWERQRGIIFTGDSVSRVPIFMFGEGRNIEAYICSMEKLRRLIPEGTRVYASHGPMELDPGLLPHLIAGAKDVLAGNIEGVKPERKLPCLQYNCGEVEFYF